MISNEEAAKMLENSGMEALPTDMKRIVIPAYGFAGAVDAKRQEWGADGPYMEDVKGLPFCNPKDAKKEGELNQVLKKKDGILLCYDAPGRVEKINAYLKENPDALSTSVGIKKFIGYMTKNVVNAGGKGDLWDADLDFAAGLKGVPAREDMKPGKIFTGVKTKEIVKVAKVNEGEQFEGATGHPQTAGKGGAYIIKDKSGMRLIQAAEFKNAYEFTAETAAKIRQQSRLANKDSIEK